MELEVRLLEVRERDVPAFARVRVVPPIRPRAAVVRRMPLDVRLAAVRERLLCPRLVVPARDRVVDVDVRRRAVLPLRVDVARVAVVRPPLRDVVVRLRVVPRVLEARVDRPALVVRRPVPRPIVERERVVDVRPRLVRVGVRFAGAFCACCIRAGRRCSIC